MSSFRSHLSVLLCLAVTGQAQTPPGAPPPARPVAGEKIERLDKFVVSAGPDPKTAFDLAQGTSVLTGDDLRRLAQATLGETLAGTPGVSSTYYGPGASRPLIRGLGGDRIRILDNGVGALDASNISPDHNAAIEPLFASRIEVLRGPSTLLFGSSAVGGVVNVINNTIPDTAPDGRTHGTAELRWGGAARERAGIASIDGGNPGVGLHLNLLRQKTDDVRIPGVARVDEDAPLGQLRGRLPGSDTATFTLAGGATRFWSGGHAGIGITRYQTDYGVPTGEVPPTSIQMRQTRFDFNGELGSPIDGIRQVKARLGYGNYRHAERSGRAVTTTTFTNRAWEGRLELPHQPLGKVTGTIGLQGSRSDFAAVGEEVVTPPSLTTTGAVFALEELKLNERTTFQLGARVEGQSVRLGEVDASLPSPAGYVARSQQSVKSAGGSGSAGLVFYPAKDWSLGLSAAYTERVPTVQELFSNGPHGGTASYEIGTTNLGNERSLGVDVNLRRRAGFMTGTLSAFVNRFGDYIFQQELPLAAIPPRNNPEGLTPFRFVATDARFYGMEAELDFHVIDDATRNLHVALMSDYVRASDTRTSEPLPRIPPLRYGAKIGYGDGRWTAEFEVRHTESQKRFSASEMSTAGYTLLNVSVAFRVPTKHAEYECFARGNNLTDQIAREHTSFLKDFAPLPGRGVLAGIRMNF